MEKTPSGVKSIMEFGKNIFRSRQPTDLLQPGNNHLNPEGHRLEAGEAHDYEQLRKERPFLVIGTFFTAAGVALQALQTKTGPLPASFYCFLLALESSFAALMVSIYIYPFLRQAALVLEYAGLLFCSAAVFMLINMDLNLAFVLISVAIYLVSILVIIIINRNRFTSIRDKANKPLHACLPFEFPI